MKAEIKSFYDPATNTFSYVAADPGARRAAVIDPVLDYEPKSARTGTAMAEAIAGYVRSRGWELDWILETHAHADHLSGAAVLRDMLGGRVAIGEGIRKVQQHFARVYGRGADFPTDGSQFDHLFSEGDTFSIGSLQGRVLATPGHTDDSLTYLIGDAAFIGDTLFRPDYGTARCDFPGGDARRLYESVHKLYALPPDTRLFLCHDYPPAGQPPRCEVSVAAQREGNVMLRHDTPVEEFVRRRTERDAQLQAPALIIPALQVNIRAGHMPPVEADGRVYLRIPVNAF
jgi:glyoxylase-like metal-dependent hydrolase (beta-lactamase superfamily II)